MARNEEKSHSMLNRWLLLEKRQSGVIAPAKKRPFRVEECNDVNEAVNWRSQVVKEIAKSVLNIQNGLYPHVFVQNTLMGELETLIWASSFGRVLFYFTYWLTCKDGERGLSLEF
ncbi:pre-mRNA-splicing factor ISY1 [Patescibacteria group bacterium]|nr:pre-mRNA-splicing factor ISY1 [Patescibacteria group bacterium]